MDWTVFASTCGMLLSIIVGVTTLINTKSNKDKASATEVAEMKAEIRELRTDLKGKVDVVLFTEAIGKIDSLTEMIKKLTIDMHSVLNDSNTNSNALAVGETKIIALEARVKKIEAKIYKED